MAASHRLPVAETGSSRAERRSVAGEFEDAAAKLHVAFSLAHDPLVARARPLLRKRVFTFVDEKKAAGWSAERVVAALKRIARAAGLPVSENPAASPTFADRIYAESAEWALARYHR